MWCRLQATARYASAAVYSVMGDPESVRLLVPPADQGVTDRQRNVRHRLLGRMLAKHLSDSSANGALLHKAIQVRPLLPDLTAEARRRRAGL